MRIVGDGTNRSLRKQLLIDFLTNRTRTNSTRTSIGGADLVSGLKVSEVEVSLTQLR